MNIWISGGTGTLGKEITKQLYSEANRIVIFSRDEAKQAKMAETFPEYPDNIMRYHVGDIRDERRVLDSMQGCDHIIHTAALKRIDTCESNIFEAIATNVQGSINVARSAIAVKAKKAVFISTDKACNSVSTYGNTKAIAENVFTNANNYAPETCLYCVRYGNVSGSRGSVFELWRKQRDSDQPLTITDKRMTRFFWSIHDAAKFVINTLPMSQRGMIYVPKMEKHFIFDLAKEYDTKIKEIGLRCSEKLHEDLISSTEARHTWYNKSMYTIHPVKPDWGGSKPVGSKLSKGISSYMIPEAEMDMCYEDGCGGPGGI